MTNPVIRANVRVPVDRDGRIDRAHGASDDDIHLVAAALYGGKGRMPPPCPKCGNPPPGGPGGMPVYGFHPTSAALVIDDAPLGYVPPIGPVSDSPKCWPHFDVKLVD